MNRNPDPVESLLCRLVEVHGSNRPLVLLTDYDGTLTPFAPHPSWARISSEVRRTLARLAACPDVFIGIISGRSIDNLKDLVGLSSLYYAGTGGLELDLLGNRIDHPQAHRIIEQLNDWCDKLGVAIARYPGTWLERKPFGVTVHYRKLNTELFRPFQVDLLHVLDQLYERPKLLDVRIGLEVTPELGWDRGTAVDMIVDDAAREGVPAFVGDVTYDLDAMRAARRRGGLAIGVGGTASAETDFCLTSPEVFANVLTRLARAFSTS